jgi:hypothetical protein
MNNVVNTNTDSTDYWQEMPATRIGWELLKLEPHIIEVGDIVHTQGRSLFSRIIRWVTRSSTEKLSWSSHSALVLDVGSSIEVIDTAGVRVILRPIQSYETLKSKVLVSRVPGGLSTRQKEMLVAKAVEYEGRLYGVFKLFTHALDRFFDNRYVFRRLATMDQYPICSWIVAYSYKRVLGLMFGSPPNAAQPDDILDYCMASRWTCVWVDTSRTLEECRRIYGA